MIANYHTHTKRCMHAIGEDREYVERAIAEGIKVLGFSDHGPMPYKNYESYYKMTLGELPEYINSVSTLRDEFADKIKIHIGLEVEYYPSLWEQSLRLWNKYPVEYLLLGQHFVGEETDPMPDPAPRGSADEKRLIQYVDRATFAIETGRITYIAHPDLLNYTGADMNLYFDEMSRLIDVAKAHSMPLEYNLLGVAAGRAYPRREFFEEVARRGANVIIGCDAHEPYRVADKTELKRAYRELESIGVNVVEDVNLVYPFFGVEKE